MADDEKQVLEQARRLPLEERVEHKNWKVRSEALDHIKEQCTRARSSQDAIFAEAGPLMKGLVGDSNANNMDKALDALVAYLEKADEAQASRIAGPVCATIAAKALKARPGTIAKASEACMLFVELEQQAAVVEGIMRAFADKVPKVVVAALDIIAKAVSSFGTQVMDVKTIIKGLPAVFGASQNDVRNKAKELTVELAAYLGGPVVAGSLLEKMPAAMKKDVEKLLEELPPGKRQPDRYTRKEQAARAEAPDQPEPMDVDDVPAAVEEEEQDAGLDAYEFATPKEILGPLAKEQVVVGDDKAAFWDCFESKKWALRKKAMEKVREAASVTRLAPGDYGELVRELKKVLAKDANINCAAEAANVAGALGLGLRKDFTSYAKQLCPAILERFKEKNIVMSKAAEESLRVLFEHCLAVGDAVEDLAAVLEHKNPKVRLDTAKLVKDVLEKTPKAQVMKVQGSLLPALAKLALDSDAGIRDAAQGAMVVFAVKAGNVAVLDKVMDKLDDSRKKKIEEMVQEAIKAAAPAGSKPPARAASAGSSRPGTSGPAAATSRANPPLAPKNTNAARPSAMAAAAAAGAAKASAPPRRTTGTASSGAAKPKAVAGGSGGGTAAEEDESSVNAPKLSNEELEEKMLEMFGSSIVEALRSAKWQDRLEAMGSVVGKVEEMGEDLDASLLMQVVGFLPGWGDKNFQVLNKSFDLVAHVARTAQGFSKRDAIYAMEGLAEKVHELKHKEKVCEALSLISEAVGPMFVATLLHKRAAANKNPKVLSEALGWIAETVQAFGLATMNVKTIIDWMKADLGSASAPVRNKAMEVLGKCHAQLGPGLVDFLEGLKPAQLTALEEHFRQNPKTEVVPTRKMRRAAKAGGTAGKGKAAAQVAAADDEEEEGGVPSLDDLLPRTDISGRVTPSLVSMLTSSNWKERNAGVLEVEAILREANSRIGPNVGELLGAMKGRLADSNRNLAAKALTVVGDIARAMGPAFDKQGRTLLGPALANLSDNKKQVRDAVVAMLDSWATIVPPDRLFPAVLEAIANPKCIADGKITGLQWMTKVVSEGHGKKCGEPALRAVLLGTQDKAANVREAGNALLAELVKELGRDPLLQACASLDSAQKKAAQELLSKALGTAALAAPAAAAVAAPSRPATATAPKAAEPAPRAAASRPGTSRSAGTAGGSLSRTASTVDMQEPKGPLLLLSAGKADRAKKYRPRPGKFDALNPEEIEILERELGAVSSDQLRALLFSKDFKKHLEAAELLMAQLPELLEEACASLDLLFRWVVLRICDGNMQSLVKVLEMCKVVLEALIEAQYSLTEYEAALLLPCVVEKAGHNQDRMRALHRDVMRLSGSLISPAKVLDYLVLGLGSKNNRTKIECCEEIGCIIQREGMAPLLSCKSRPMPAVAQLLTERDGATRSAALGTIELAWAEEGDNIWKLLGRLENREREMVEDRLKRSKLQPRVQAQPAAVPAAPEATPVLRRPQTSAYPAAVVAEPLASFGRRVESDTLEYSRPAFTPPAVLDTPVPGRPAALGYPAAAPAMAAGIGGAALAYSAAPTPIPPSRPPPSPSGVAPFGGDEAAFREQWMHAMFGINSPDMHVVVENMKALCGDIMAAALADGPSAASMRAIMATSANELFSTINRLMPKLLDAAEGEAIVTGRAPSSRGCKYALNVLLQGIAVQEVSMALPQGTLRETISLLLLLLLDERGLVNYEEGSTLMKAINVLMLKMLEATNRTYTFSALLQLLREPPPEIRQTQLPKFYDLVVKCLIKLTKSLQTNMEGVDLQDLLFSVHDFFMHLGVDEIRKRSSSDDKPLRMVKTILHELCKMKGYDIYTYAQNIPGRNAEPQPIIFAYIALNLQTLAQSGIIQGPQEGSGMHGSASAGSLTRDGGSDEVAGDSLARPQMSEAEKAEVKARLKDIMGRLMHPDQTWAAMEELYFLRKEHSAYVEKYLSTAKVSESFQRYINDGLEEVEQRMLEEEQGEAAAPELDAEPAPVPVQPRIPRLPLGSSAVGGSMLRASPPAVVQRPTALAVPSPPTNTGFSADRGALSARSEGSQSSRLSGVRERLSQLRMSGDGTVISPQSAARVDVANMRSSIEELQARMQSLRRSQS